MSNEILADRLGQIVFRLETNVEFLSQHVDPDAASGGKMAQYDIQADLEKLKEIKTELLNL